MELKDFAREMVKEAKLKAPTLPQLLGGGALALLAANLGIAGANLYASKAKKKK